MSQTSYQNFPDAAREGFLADSAIVRDIVSRISEEAASPFVPFGKLVVATTGQSEKLAKLPTAAADITTAGIVHGVAMADTSKETPKGATFGYYAENDAIPCVRKGRIWVVSEDEVTDLDQGVYVRFQNPGGSPPDASLGSFAAAAGADYALLAGARWRTRTTGTFGLAIVELDL